MIPLNKVWELLATIFETYTSPISWISTMFSGDEFALFVTSWKVTLFNLAFIAQFTYISSIHWKSYWASPVCPVLYYMIGIQRLVHSDFLKVFTDYNIDSPSSLQSWNHSGIWGSPLYYRLLSIEHLLQATFYPNASKVAYFILRYL